ncbi:AraC family transcriptional regulator [Pseudoteredinibacter isoporae]|uniref:AraC family transcriptional regulator n=1 Tax=Pseudoteredinibacter isoporae TaxID=570281 RepID=A0A7X0JU83_9GAMM|nr:GyrI-like domain-containing protein [Pseudoteredinibacter isoporae]MBB6522372.1 AraC family transcriptional regulator [Pseudoteredinibacter isoporae]NHO87905.1 AraC family transcriptional regulator [Pseudoteredinibacter isoporae]NIB23764.1 AraC family transcriptional regulator [Pseudoteredinibacter isoporae]
MNKTLGARSYQRMGEALTIIDAQLDGDLAIRSICERLHVSEFHFQRQFKACWKVSFAECVRLLRMKRAAYCLVFRSEQRILDIALQAGYDSAEAFSRAFKRYSDQSPRDFREQANWTALTQKLQTLEAVRELQSMNRHYTVEIVEREELGLAVYRHQGPASRLGNSIGEFIAWRKSQRLPPSVARTFNRFYEDPRESGADYRFDLACEWPVDRDWTSSVSILEGETLPLDFERLPAGRYGKIQHQGSDEAMSTAIEYLYEHWLPKSGEEVADAPLLIERLRFFPEVPESQALNHILLPLA